METNGEFFADKLMDLANLVAAGLFFAPLVAEKINWFSIALGSSFFIVILVVSYLLRKGGKR